MTRAAAIAAVLAAGAAGCGSQQVKLEAVSEPAPPDAVLATPSSVFGGCSDGTGRLTVCRGWYGYASESSGQTVVPRQPRQPEQVGPARIVARLPLPASRGGDRLLAAFESRRRGTCFTVVAGAPRCTGDPGCAELCADEWVDSAGRGVLAGLVSLRATSLRVVLDDGSTRSEPLDGPTLGPLADRRRIFMLDLGRRHYRLVEALDLAGGRVAHQPYPS